MPLMINPSSVEPVVRSLVGAIDVEDGPTDEQIAVLRAIVQHVWERGDLDVVALTPLDVVRTLPRDAQELLGYAAHDALAVGGGYLGAVEVQLPLRP